MNQEQKDRWVAALRSGEFKQGDRVLAYIEYLDDNQFEVRNCCLGVGLCVLPPPGSYWTAESDYISLVDSENLIVNVMPPVSWRRFAGLDRQAGGEALDYIKANIGEHNIPSGEDWAFVLTDLNDQAAATFDQIADVIERFLPVDDEEAIVDETIRS